MAKQDNQDEGQAKGLLDGNGKSMQEKVNDTQQKVKSVKKVINFIKKHPMVAKVLFFVALAIVVIILLTMIIYAVMGAEESDATISLEATISNMQKVNRDGSELDEENEEDNITRTMTAGTIQEESGNYFYEILYGEDSEEKNKERINSIKAELSKKEIEIYNNQCLLFLAVMVENGLDISIYNKADLEAMYMFFKAEIATSSLDLGTGETLEDKIVPKAMKLSNEESYEDNENETSNEKIYSTYNEKDYDEEDYSNDRIYGTIKVQRVTYEKVGNVADVATTKQLKYISLEKFENLIDENNESVKDYFSLDEENNLIVAGQKKTSTNIELIEDECKVNGSKNEEWIKEVKTDLEEDLKGNSEETTMYKYKSIPYLNYISKYTMPFSFLMSLLAVTNDAEFCKQVAKIAESSSITITLHEEYSETITTIETKHEETEKIYAKITADISATTSTEKNETEFIDISGKTELEIMNEYNPEGNPVSEDEDERVGAQTIYTWEYGGATYYLTKGNGTMSLKKITKKNSSEEQTTEINNLFLDKGGEIKNGYPGELDRFHNLTESPNDLEYLEWYKELKNYTKEKKKEYTVKQTINNESYLYSMEITEVDNWYEYYKKTYSEVTNEDLGEPTSSTEEDVIPFFIDNLIEDPNVIKEMDYIKNIEDDEKKSVIKNELGTDENYNFNVKKIQEESYTFGKNTITIEKSGNSYKREGAGKEEIQVKVQKNNKNALLNITADAFGTQNKDDENSDVEEIYSITDGMENSFLYVYDKYQNVQDTFKSIDEWAYEMLDKRESCKGMTTLLKYLIFLYDGTDMGTSEYDLTLLKPGDFKEVTFGISAIAEWLRSYENNWLREYRNGTGTAENNKLVIDRNYARENPETGEIEYGLELLDLENDHSLNYSYGLRVYDYPSKTVSNLYKQYFLDEGLDLDALVNEYLNGAGYGWASADAIDRIQIQYINSEKQDIINKYKDKGVTLEGYEVDALLACSYAFGQAGSGILWEENIELVKKYKAGEIGKEEFIEQFKGSRGYPFIYSSSPARGEAHRLMFFEGRYILKTGEEINPNDYLGGNLVQVGTYFHQKMENEQWVYYTDRGKGMQRIVLW